MEEIDMNMTDVYSAMDQGFEIINKDKEDERLTVNLQNEWELYLQDHLIRMIDLPLLPYIHNIGLHYPENKSYSDLRTAIKKDLKDYGGWFEIKIPEFALMAIYIDLAGRKSYFVFDPKKVSEKSGLVAKGEILATNDDWQSLALNMNIKDHRIALALAKKAWSYYLQDQEEKSSSSPLAEPKDEPVYEVFEDDFRPTEIFDVFSETGYEKLVQLVRTIIREEM